MRLFQRARIHEFKPVHAASGVPTCERDAPAWESRWPCHTAPHRYQLEAGTSAERISMAIAIDNYWHRNLLGETAGEVLPAPRLWHKACHEHGHEPTGAGARSGVFRKKGMTGRSPA